MYILEIANGFPTSKYPLQGVFETDQAKALLSIGNKVIFASVDLRSIRRWRRWGLFCIRQNNLKIYNVSIPVGNIPYILIAGVFSLALNILYKKITKLEGIPDILHAHFSNPVGYATAKLSNKEKIPFIITEHSSSLNEEVINNSERKITLFAMKKANKVICVSHTLQQKILFHFGILSIVIPNIVDTSIFSNDGTVKNDRFAFIAAASLLQRKGFDILIQAFTQAFPDSTEELFIIGDGPEKQKLVLQIKKLNMTNRIKLLGQKGRNAISELFKKTHIFVLASRNETFGIVYIEALASGLPVIATKCGGPEDFINSTNGVSVEVDNIQELRDQLKNMKGNYNFYDAKKISEEAKANFSPVTIAQKLQNVFLATILFME